MAFCELLTRFVWEIMGNAWAIINDKKDGLRSFVSTPILHSGLTNVSSQIPRLGKFFRYHRNHSTLEYIFFLNTTLYIRR